MGDVFRGGNQNVVATVESEKIGTQEFMNYLRQINLNADQIAQFTGQVYGSMADLLGILPGANLALKKQKENFGKNVCLCACQLHRC